MTRSELDARMPEEFWREVVDRVAVEAPDTLLLAEAFWLLEGYFVRSLGMHRVYNSAFMNMLRDERNADYRQLLRSTLEFDPRILKRYVNFMSNPDERTAVDQFGRDGKYFGVATLMATLPGLPMFAHGQVEGLSEKYGMEFYRARWAEQPDPGLVRRHERQLFPLLARRRAFAEVEHFQLYDLVGADGRADDNVFAYSNGTGDERSLVLFHNRYAETSGWIRRSCPVQAEPGRGDEHLRTTSIAEALALPSADDHFVVLRDAAGGLEYLRSCLELHEQGLYVELAAYELHVFLDLREVVDGEDRLYRRLALELEGRGVASVDEAAAELDLEAVLAPFRRLVAPEPLAELVDAAVRSVEPARAAELAEAVADPMLDWLEAVRVRLGADDRRPAGAPGLRDLVSLLSGAGEEDLAGRPRPGEASPLWPAAIAWVLVRRVDEISPADRSPAAPDRLLDGLFLLANLERSLRRLGYSEAAAKRATAAVRVLRACEGWWRPAPDGSTDLLSIIGQLVASAPVAAFLGINRFDGEEWFVKESWNDLLDCLAISAAVDAPELARCSDVQEALTRLAAARDPSGYRVRSLLEILESTP